MNDWYETKDRLPPISKEVLGWDRYRGFVICKCLDIKGWPWLAMEGDSADILEINPPDYWSYSLPPLNDESAKKKDIKQKLILLRNCLERGNIRFLMEDITDILDDIVDCCEW